MTVTIKCQSWQMNWLQIHHRQHLSGCVQLHNVCFFFQCCNTWALFKKRPVWSVQIFTTASVSCEEKKEFWTPVFYYPWILNWEYLPQVLTYHYITFKHFQPWSAIGLQQGMYHIIKFVLLRSRNAIPVVLSQEKREIYCGINNDPQ